ncbi:MAG: alpha/beta hydrolase-fold protein [Gemmatimonadales bacterium]
MPHPAPEPKPTDGPPLAPPDGWERYAAIDESPVPLLRYRDCFSPELRNFRDLLVALPPGYARTTRRYPVVYVQDGQNLFDPETSYAGDWGLRATLARLATDGVEAIVVGVPNAGRYRLYEYGPFRDPRLGGGGGDRYLDFLIGTVKPRIEHAFRARREPAATAIAGSSMGGLISLYGFYRSPEVFGAAGALSPSLWFAEAKVLPWVERWAAAGLARARRLYLDIGLEEGERAVADVRALRDILSASGLTPARDYRYVEDEGAAHDEAAWGRRIARALPYLIGADPRREVEDTET